MTTSNEEEYRSKLRNHFMGKMKNPKLQQSAAQHYKEHISRSQKMAALEGYHQHQHQEHQHQHQQYQQQKQRQFSLCSGGDADRALYDTSLAGGYSSRADSYRTGYNETSNFSRQFSTKHNKQTPLALPMAAGASNGHTDDANVFLYETDSNMGGCGSGGGGPGSEDSTKSLKSSKTVVSKRSSQDLRKMVRSQCKLHEVIDETLKQMCATDQDPMSNCGGVGAAADCRLTAKEGQVTQAQVGLQQKTPPSVSCRRCCERVCPRSIQKDVMTEISKGDFLEYRSGETLTISVDDVVNSKVINPMIRKLQRMYLNNLREEMSLMEDLERLPHRVNEVYKATIFKQKE